MSLKKSILFAKREYAEWITNPKISILFILIVFIYRNITVPLLDQAKLCGLQMNIFEPILAVGTSKLLFLIMPIVFMTIISGFPDDKSGGWYWMIRIGRNNWVMGQLLFAIMSIFSFVIVVFLGTTIPVLGKAEFGSDYSRLTREYSSVYYERFSVYISGIIPKNLYNQIGLLKALIHTVLLMILYLFLLTTILLVMSILKKKILGFLIDCIIIVLGATFGSFETKLKWLLPGPHSMVNIHFTEYYRWPILNIGISYIYLISFCLVMCVVAFIIIGRTQFYGGED